VALVIPGAGLSAPNVPPSVLGAPVSLQEHTTPSEAAQRLEGADGRLLLGAHGIEEEGTQTQTGMDRSELSLGWLFRAASALGGS
jgi:hypothetical protein